MICDHERIRLISRNKPDLARNLIGLFLRELPNIKNEIEQASAVADAAQLAESCHRLKSALGNFVSPEFYQEVSALETSARNQTLTEWRAAWPQTDNKLKQLTEELHQMCR
ncbi:Hpt domain-containing protein [Spongiibacter sp. KMU-158]|uniref:Hpt domain-containing protein n=1 Tax=Spongiibacter pelagi TaxID=2760804 RepID=A0A927GW70_9GAMM|nr:Hpt domain-containing protein [Spongiibacter pelagi]MBD2858124.1 Hpt domain-containing protein [Spongiibacter pelagi]